MLLSAASKGAIIAQALIDSLDGFRRVVADRDLFVRIVLDDQDSHRAALLLKLGATIDDDFRKVLAPRWEALLHNPDSHSITLLLLQTDAGLQEQCFRLFVDESNSLTELWHSLLLAPQQADFVHDVMAVLPALREQTCRVSTLTLALSLLGDEEQAVGAVELVAWLMNQGVKLDEPAVAELEQEQQEVLNTSICQYNYSCVPLHACMPHAHACPHVQTHAHWQNTYAQASRVKGEKRKAEMLELKTKIAQMMEQYEVDMAECKRDLEGGFHNACARARAHARALTHIQLSRLLLLRRTH